MAYIVMCVDHAVEEDWELLRSSSSEDHMCGEAVTSRVGGSNGT